MKPTKRDIMRSANANSPSEGLSEALRKSHKAAKGVFVGNGKVVLSLKNQNRLFSNYNYELVDTIESPTIDIENVDFGML